MSTAAEQCADFSACFPSEGRIVRLCPPSSCSFQDANLQRPLSNQGTLHPQALLQTPGPVTHALVAGVDVDLHAIVCALPKSAECTFLLGLLGPEDEGDTSLVHTVKVCREHGAYLRFCDSCGEVLSAQQAFTCDGAGCAGQEFCGECKCSSKAPGHRNRALKLGCDCRTKLKKAGQGRLRLPPVHSVTVVGPPGACRIHAMFLRWRQGLRIVVLNADIAFDDIEGDVSGETFAWVADFESSDPTDTVQGQWSANEGSLGPLWDMLTLAGVPDSILQSIFVGVSSSHDFRFVCCVPGVHSVQREHSTGIVALCRHMGSLLAAARRNIGRSYQAHADNGVQESDNEVCDGSTCGPSLHAVMFSGVIGGAGASWWQDFLRACAGSFKYDKRSCWKRSTDEPVLPNLPKSLRSVRILWPSHEQVAMLHSTQGVSAAHPFASMAMFDARRLVRRWLRAPSTAFAYQGSLISILVPGTSGPIETSTNCSFVTYLGSAGLSDKSWGKVSKAGSRVICRAFELGVCCLHLPGTTVHEQMQAFHTIRCESLSVPWLGRAAIDGPLVTAGVTFFCVSTDSSAGEVADVRMQITGSDGSIRSLVDKVISVGDTCLKAQQAMLKNIKRGSRGRAEVCASRTCAVLAFDEDQHEAKEHPMSPSRSQPHTISPFIAWVLSVDS